MRTEITFHDRKIPVRFILSDQKTIPLLIQVLESCRTQAADSRDVYIDQVDLIEVVGNNAILYRDDREESLRLPLT